MMNAPNRVFLVLTVALPPIFFGFSSCGGAQTPPGATIIIHGPANDQVDFTAMQVPSVPSCTCLAKEKPGGSCTTFGSPTLPSGPLDPDGFVDTPPIPKVADDSQLTGFSNAGPTPCMIPSTSILACPTAAITVTCSATNTAAAQGHATVAGAEDTTTYQKCTRWLAGGDCANWETIDVDNSGVVSLTLNGQTVSVTYGSGSTPFSLGVALAIAMNQNSTLASQLMSAPNGPVVYVNAINTGTQYDYPWTTSCTYNSKYFSACSFSIALSPSASLTSPSAPQ